VMDSPIWGMTTSIGMRILRYCVKCGAAPLDYKITT
jgi:hypothetical protein